MVDIAQLVRALDCGSRGRGFESHYLPKKLPRNEAIFILNHFYLSNYLKEQQLLNWVGLFLKVRK
jgi:hypothetical protein